MHGREMDTFLLLLVVLEVAIASAAATAAVDPLAIDK